MGAPRSIKRRGWPDNLYQQPSGYFYYRNPQSKKVKGIGKDRAVAFSQARAANAVLATLTKSTLAVWVSGVEQYSLADWMDRYEPLWIAEDRPAPGTLKTAQRYIKRFKLAEFAWMQMPDITTKHIAEYLDELGKGGHSVAMNMRARLHDIFRMAETKGVIGTGLNPVSATSVPEYVVRRERLSLEQFLAVRAKVSVPAANAMNLALMTGQRREDVAAMKFADYRDGYLFIVQGKTGHKLQQSGTIRLDAVNMSIDDVVRQCRDRVISKYLCHHRRTSGKYKAGDPISVSGLTSGFANARDEIGIVGSGPEKTPPTFHEIRSLSERLYKKQYGQEFAQSIMGHKHAKMTAEYDDLRGSGWSIVDAK
jgi:integrase